MTYGSGRTGVDWSKDTDADGNEIPYSGSWTAIGPDGSESPIKLKFIGRQPLCIDHMEGLPHNPCWRLVFADEVTP